MPSGSGDEFFLIGDGESVSPDRYTDNSGSLMRTGSFVDIIGPFTSASDHRRRANRTRG
jgi:hypothetical protein